MNNNIRISSFSIWIRHRLKAYDVRNPCWAKSRCWSLVVRVSVNQVRYSIFPLLFHHVKVVYVRVEWSESYVITICCWAQSFTWSEEVLKSVCYHPWLLFRIYIIQQQLSQLDCRTHTETRILGTTKAIERELSYTRSLSAATQGSEFTIEHNRVRCSRFGFIHRSTSTFTLLMLNNNKSLCL